MKLFLDVRDLKPEFREQQRVGGMTGGMLRTIAFDDISFEHLNDAAQTAVTLVGEAAYRDIGFDECVFGKLVRPPKS
ncbi:MAG: hypothetical protein HY226_05175 [Candidatus Vogelbacteria bacterium]|nr:hypothetical protein [Candidatus Vogelbacteria bacterium]